MQKSDSRTSGFSIQVAQELPRGRALFAVGRKGPLFRSQPQPVTGLAVIRPRKGATR